MAIPDSLEARQGSSSRVSSSHRASTMVQFDHGRWVEGVSALGVGVFAGGSKGRASFAIRLFVWAAGVRVGRTLVLFSLDNGMNWQARARRRCEL